MPTSLHEPVSATDTSRAIEERLGIVFPLYVDEFQAVRPIEGGEVVGIVAVTLRRGVSECKISGGLGAKVGGGEG